MNKNSDGFVIVDSYLDIDDFDELDLIESEDIEIYDDSHIMSELEDGIIYLDTKGFDSYSSSLDDIYDLDNEEADIEFIGGEDF